MRVSHVALDDYRSYQHAVVELSPGVTVLVGANGQGKTNLVEAIAYLSAFSSHRVSAEAALVRIAREGEDPVGGAVIRVKLIRGESSEHLPVSEHVIELEIVRGKANRAMLNRTQVRPREILGMVRTVVFAPEDLQLVRSDPAVRRAFLDDVVIQSQPVMAGVKADFERVARQRAAVLKNAQAALRRGYTPNVDMLDVWDDQFAALSARVTAEREKVVRALREPSVRAYDAVADSPKHVTIDLDASVNAGQTRDSQALGAQAQGGHGGQGRQGSQGGQAHAAHTQGGQLGQPRAEGILDDMSGGDLTDVEAQTERLRLALRAARDKEIERGVNIIGAHRDDLTLTLGGMPVKGYASHGESWSVALALKLAAFEVLTEGDEQPILILDDVFAELDARRRRGLSEVISQVHQVLITAAVEDDVPAELRGSTLYVHADPTVGTRVQATPFTDEATRG